MTATRLREIASMIEGECVKTRKARLRNALDGPTEVVPCPECARAAKDLCLCESLEQIMTPAQIRAIAGRLEQVCIEARKLCEGVTIACPECLRAVGELRALAEQMGPKRKPSGFSADSSIELPPAIAALPDQNGVEAEGRTNL
jgi:hypothetical protein